MIRRANTVSFLVSAGAFFLFLIDKKLPVPTAKQIEKTMARINDSLYACRYETSNADYKIFLSTLEDNPARYEQYRIDSSGWDKISFYQEPLRDYYYRHPAFANYPLVNVSYDGAIAYCKWLTDVYNSDRGRKFEKVLFTLPDTTQWITAATGSWVKGARYPWGNHEPRDENGKYRCNIKHFNESMIIEDSLGNPMIKSGEWNSMFYHGDGGRSFYTVPVISYEPNGFGLYNICGNVAEMTIEKGMAKGGGWNNFAGDIRIQNIRRYDGIWPDIGFRVFMKIINR
jgi:formylglycine-generating enzyme required for sulfatase activity